MEWGKATRYDGKMQQIAMTGIVQRAMWRGRRGEGVGRREEGGSMQCNRLGCNRLGDG